MKLFISTKMLGTGAEGDYLRPFLADQDVSASMMTLDDGMCVCRVAGDPSAIAIVAPHPDIDVLDDSAALSVMRGKYHECDLENVDIPDPEIDEIAKANGLDPHLRADIKTPSRGNQVLQDQENYLMAMISTKKGKSKQFWDDEAGKSGKYPKGIDIENAIIDGNNEVHEFVMSRLR